ncbi:2OG-Fe(II) oxygenase [Dokdonella sp.]|uniref:2OG-Fe(II) oxygenase n=1 Tax=Dokdonella sp. TaxID=2291710 RepID=UPI001B0DD8E0|nr:2OG-Fe(II) oxygenase [Dokdonella sp.]MBO9662754.1 2OG-Fe(II) oxygenase [Dokdonella sp.]
MTASIDRLDWADIAAQLDAEGYAMLPGLLDAEAARDLARRAGNLQTARRTSFASADLGRGERIRFDAELPAPLESWRHALYRPLAVIANRWNAILGIDDRYPADLDDFVRRNRQAGQVRPQSHVNRLGEEDYVALHQCSDDGPVFPMQVVALLSEPGTDFDGGEFVLTERRPRMQTRPMVLPLGLGDAAVIATAARPFKGSRGYYRVNLKHAISRVRRGERVGAELTFHDAR